MSFVYEVVGFEATDMQRKLRAANDLFSKRVELELAVTWFDYRSLARL